MRVRRFQARDARQASKVMRAAFRSFLGERYGKDLDDRLAPAALARGSLSKGRFGETVSFVALDGARVVGYVTVSADRNGLGSLGVIGVDPDHFRRGVGTLLMLAAERFWARKKQRKIATCVSAHNRRAVSYYLAHGFVPEGFCRDHFTPGVDEIMLGRFL